MRTVFSAAAAALALAACNPSTPAKEAEVQTEASAAAAAPAMDATTKGHDAADDVATSETPDGHMFHTAPAKAETVHLPSAGVWTATASDAALVAVGEGADAPMPDGTRHRVFKLTPKASGNASVKFERRDSAAGPVAETRTVQVMIH